MEILSQWWLLSIGFIGQAFFFMRFFLAVDCFGKSTKKCYSG